MDKYESVRVKFVSKRIKRHVRPKVVPINTKESNEDCYIKSISHITSGTKPTSLSNTSSTVRLVTHGSKISSSPFDVVDQPAKKNVKDLRKEKKKLRRPWCITVVILIVLLILSTIAMSIYLPIRFTAKTASVTPVITPSLRWNSTGVTVAGLGGSSGANASELNLPVDVVLKSLNTIYIADFFNNRIQKWIIGSSIGTTVAGQSNGTSGNTSAYLNGAAGVYIDSNDSIYVSDTYNNRVQFWGEGASLGSTIDGTGIGGSSNNQLSNPYAISQDVNTKTLYIADYNNHRIMTSNGILAAGGNGPGISNTQLFYPVGVYFDSFTNSLIIGNSIGNNIVRWVLGENSWTLVAGSINGSFGSSSSLLYSPFGVTLDPMGNVYVADGYNHRIQFFSAGQSEGITIAGITNASGMNPIQLNCPYAVRLDNQLNLYVVDSFNHRIQRFSRY